MIVPVRCQLAASVVVQDVRAAHPFQLYSFLFQELIYQVSVVDPLSLVSSTINSAGHTVPLFADCSVDLGRLPLPRTRVKVCLFSFLSFLNSLYQAPVKYEYEDEDSGEVGFLC